VGSREGGTTEAPAPRDTLVGLGGVVVLSLILASCETTEMILPGRATLGTAAVIATGPICGWIEAALMHRLRASMSFLAVVSSFAIAPLAWWLWTRDGTALGFAVLAWVSVGYLLGVAVWV
jgi:transcriptional regulator of nitric oxide reductase